MFCFRSTKKAITSSHNTIKQIMVDFSRKKMLVAKQIIRYFLEDNKFQLSFDERVIFARRS